MSGLIAIILIGLGLLFILVVTYSLSCQEVYEERKAGMARNLINGNSRLYVVGTYVELNGVPVQRLKKPAKSISQINNKVYIDGYELKNGKWKMTIPAILHWLF